MPFSNWLRPTLASGMALALSLSALAQGGVKPQTVVLAARGESRVVTTTASTVGEFLAEQRIVLGDQERTSSPLTAKLTEGLHLTVGVSRETKSPVVVASNTPNRGTLASRGVLGNLARYEGKKVLTMSATGYGPGENGRWGNQTATGTRVRYGIVAVDPRVIKLGTRLYVEGYGECLAADTGGAIKGLRIDLAFNSDRVANSYGRRKVRVVILD
jgi:3D (Asp-Asp-Asp) domain-containing protein